MRLTVSVLANEIWGDKTTGIVDGTTQYLESLTHWRSTRPSMDRVAINPAMKPGFLSACLLIFCLGLRSVAASEPLISLAADLERITGRSIELHASPRAFGDHSLPAICEALANAFREVAADSDTSQRLHNIVRSVVIEEFYGGEDRVVLAGEVLTIQSLNDEEYARTLGPLIVQALRTSTIKRK